MQQGRLVTTSLAEELEGAVWALGGYQQAAAKLWPADCPIKGGERLRTALHPDRREKLSVAEVELLIVAGAEAGTLGPLERLARLCGCRAPEREPPEDVQARALEAVQQAQETLQQAIRALTESRAAPVPLRGRR